MAVGEIPRHPLPRRKPESGKLQPSLQPALHANDIGNDLIRLEIVFPVLILERVRVRRLPLEVVHMHADAGTSPRRFRINGSEGTEQQHGGDHPLFPSPLAAWRRNGRSVQQFGHFA